MPQVLLMENVPQVIGQKNIKDFQAWRSKLEQLGYSNYVQLLNAKDYGIPQSRNRCFMVSLLGEYHYEFPHKIPLKRKLKDMLEDKVDEKYYLSQKTIESFMRYNDRNKAAGNGFSFDPIERERESSKTVKPGQSNDRSDDNYIIEREREYAPTVRSGGRGSVDRHAWDLVIQAQDGGEIDIASTLMARDYKGLGNQMMTGVLETSPNFTGGVTQIRIPHGWQNLEVEEVTEIAPITTSVGRWHPLISEPTPSEDTRQPTSETPSISPIPTARQGEEESEEEWHRPSSQSRNKE